MDSDGTPDGGGARAGAAVVAGRTCRFGLRNVNTSFPFAMTVVLLIFPRLFLLCSLLSFSKLFARLGRALGFGPGEAGILAAMSTVARRALAVGRVSHLNGAGAPGILRVQASTLFIPCFTGTEYIGKVWAFILYGIRVN